MPPHFFLSRAVDFAARVPRTACSLCKGWRCTNGADHAHLEPKVAIQPARSYSVRERDGGTWMRWSFPITRKQLYLSRAVDHEGEILDISAHHDSLIAVPAIISEMPTKAHLPAV